MKRTALRPTPMSPRRIPLKRGRRRMSPEERLARRLVKRRSGGWCEIQVSRTVCTTLATDFSHIIREGQGGPWSPANGLHACRSCHMWTHHNPAASRVKRWALKSFDSLGLAVCRRGEWVLLGDDGSAIPTDPPVLAVAP